MWINTYRFCRGIGPAAARSSCPFITSTSSTTQAYFFSVYYRSHHWRETMLKGIICSRCRWGQTPVYATTGSRKFLRTLCHHQLEWTHHRYHFKHYHKILAHICLNYLLLYLQKTDTALALIMTRRIVTQKSARLWDGKHHHKWLP